MASHQCGLLLLLQVRLAADMEAHQPALEVLLKLTRRTGIRDGGIAYIAWRRNRSKVESSIVCTSGNTESNRSNGSNENGVVTDRADVEKQETDIVNDVANDNLTVQQLEVLKISSVICLGRSTSRYILA